MSKKGSLKPHSEHEEEIRNSVGVLYSVTLVRFRDRVRAADYFNDPSSAEEYAMKNVNQGYRTAFVYAVDDRERYALYSTIRAGDTDFKRPKIDVW